MMNGNNQPKEGMVPWEPDKYLETVSDIEVSYSRGFLRCRPERWFPGFETSWLTVGHTLSVEFKVVDVRPFISKFPNNLQYQFVGAVDNEPLIIGIEDSSAQNLIEVCSAGAQVHARPILVEYLARRLLTTLAKSWSGPESSVVRFDPEASSSGVKNIQGHVRLQFVCNSKAVIVYIGLGHSMLDRLDGLWRRQIHSATRQHDDKTDLFIELAQLAVPPSMLVDYIRPGTAIDLEVNIADSVSIRSKAKSLMPGRLRLCGDSYCVEVSPGQVSNATMPDGTTRLSICIGTKNVDSALLAELSQPQAIWNPAIKASDRVFLVINGEKVADAKLCVYEGRFALVVDSA